MAKPKLVTGLFKNRVAAEAAVDAIIKHGYTRDDISVLMSDATRNKEFALQTRSHAADGAGISGALGGAVGAVLAAIAAVGTTIFLPGINLVIAGPIAAALAGAGAGAATGGVIGALVGAGIPEYRAKVYDAGLRSGGILVGVEARSDEEVERLEQLLQDVGAKIFGVVLNNVDLRRDGYDNYYYYRYYSGYGQEGSKNQNVGAGTP